MLQECVAGTCRRDQIAEFTHLWKSCRDTFQRHILSCVLTLFHSCDVESRQNVSPQHVARSSWEMSQPQNFAWDAMIIVCKDMQHVPAAKTDNWANQTQDPACFAIVHLEKKMAAVHRGVRAHASNWNDWDRNRKLVVVLMICSIMKLLWCWNDKLVFNFFLYYFEMPEESTSETDL